MPRLRDPRTGAVVNVDDGTAARLGAHWGPADDAGSQSGYGDLTVDELKDEIRRRNEDRDDDSRLLLSGTKDELVASLESDDS